MAQDIDESQNLGPKDRLLYGGDGWPTQPSVRLRCSGWMHPCSSRAADESEMKHDVDGDVWTRRLAGSYAIIAFRQSGAAESLSREERKRKPPAPRFRRLGLGFPSSDSRFISPADWSPLSLFLPTTIPPLWCCRPSSSDQHVQRESHATGQLSQQAGSPMHWNLLIGTECRPAPTPPHGPQPQHLLPLYA
ncbi:uncharacterized protein MAM_04392 [Metarhizium album ARSEF 1941]|uniref:Uncharacterized protein n=1 Tax=Metarhizium album (strain ARSEF 1941) TaxID=1081103 RepID=A0A0B2WVA2_METAS|nr:uncharacterized protein MAM_04392 [Metarhizium album ARSEF 1941]KHN98003.1 hypothetical protein MAM_04392 [Metarhizium album ARSEF 1941]